MTDDEIKYLRALQPEIEKRMGSPQTGDTFICYSMGPSVIHWNPYLDSKNWCEQCLLIPLAIDPANPERGLWGMVDWDRWRAVQDLTDLSGLTWLFWMPFELNEIRIRDIMHLALLKTLAHQWGIEVKE